MKFNNTHKIQACIAARTDSSYKYQKHFGNYYPIIDVENLQKGVR